MNSILNRFEKFIAALIGVLFSISVAGTFVALVMFPQAMFKAFSPPLIELQAVFIGTGLFAGFIVALLMFLLVFAVISRKQYLIIISTYAVWGLVLEPFVKVFAGINYGIAGWLGECAIILILIVPFVLRPLLCLRQKSRDGEGINPANKER
jgi:hypothetical protein